LVKYSEASLGRVFVMRLEDGEDLHETLEVFAQEHSLESAAVLVLGGASDNSKLVVGPEDPGSSPIVPMVKALEGVHEISGVGTLVRNEEGSPVLHMHVSAGRADRAAAGCTRAGVNIWQVAEVVIIELIGSGALRKFNEKTGFVLLDFE
jgi:predicted DNA-binding protein with PD1-like motif